MPSAARRPSPPTRAAASPRVLVGTAVIAALLDGASSAQASGFLLYEQSARAISLGGAVSALGGDPSMVWFNPAALVRLPSSGAQLTAGIVRPATSFSPAGGGPDTDALSETHIIPSLFAHGRISDDAQLGIGLFAPFGLAFRWPGGWAGEQYALSTELTVLAFNPTVAVQLAPRLSAAAGVSVLRGSVALGIGLPEDVGGGTAEMTGSAWGLSGNAALFVEVQPEAFHLSLTYRSRATMGFSGRADFSPMRPEFAVTLPDQPARADITLPDVITLGAMIAPDRDLRLSVEVSQVYWSTFNQLVIDFEQPSTPDRILERTTRNPFDARAGAEWLWAPDLGLALRVGAAFSQSTSDGKTLAPAAPDGHRLTLGAGIGVRAGLVDLDVAYMYAHFFAAEATPPPPAADGTSRAQSPAGTYRTRAHLVAVSVTLR